MSLDEYRYLWDGSQPGWTLHRVNQIDWTVTFHFDATGPSALEVSAMRTLLDCFRDLPMAAVWAQLRDRSSYTTTDSVGNLEMRWLVDAADRAGLRTTPNPTDSGGLLPVHVDGHALIIEDEKLAAEVMLLMLDAGVPATDVHVD
ncbi:hypothetical protein [Rhodopirellula sp. P2]|uniref:hypothetical protein n=1 Tax=Rhodopirellula sp. P2 TaxID=2127060 RepID=UPI002367E16F|nr:hypothetical protein [Rhodopirellula sp. P2]WDQ16156.1 hypothetical protein PSR62_21370 [Rhodopirellula sp. P2]